MRDDLWGSPHNEMTDAEEAEQERQYELQEAYWDTLMAAGPTEMAVIV